jgi:hypothetical protein
MLKAMPRRATEGNCAGAKNAAAAEDMDQPPPQQEY